MLPALLLSVSASLEKDPTVSVLVYVEGKGLGWGLLTFCCSDVQIQRPRSGIETNEANKAVE